MAVKCWAKVLGDCGVQSREHYATAGLWEDNAILASGFAWCLEEPRAVGLGSATAKILCKPHNEQLSPIDRAAIDAFGALREAQRIQIIREARPNRRWLRRFYDVDGVLLERWFVKTAIDLVNASGARVSWFGGLPPLEPPDRLVRVAYGLEPAGEHLGIYAVTNSSTPAHLREVLNFLPLLREGKEVVAGFVEFRGFRFLLSLVDQAIPPSLLRSLGQEGYDDADLTRRPKEIEFKIGRRVSQVVRFRW